MSTGGRLLNGRYALSASPRTGGMATVFKASDLENDNQAVAVKLLNRGSGDERLLAKVFEREYGSLRRLEHPNIVRLLDGGRDDETGHRFFVFEWFERDFQSLLDARPGDPWGWDDFYTEVGEGLLSGLARAHEVGIAHRDITPGNILIAEDGSPRITDFGIAKIATDIAPGMTLANYRTEPYAPPAGEPFEFIYTRDVFSFAVVALISVSGVNPYAEAYAENRSASVGDALQSGTAPREVLRFLETCVSPDPLERPRDANAALSEMRRIHAKRQEAARAAGFVARPRYHMHLTRRAREALRLDFDVATDEEAGRLFLEDLADEVGFLPLRSAVFQDGSSTEGHFELLGAELRCHVQIASDKLLVHTVTRDSSSFLARQRERAQRVFADFSLGSPRDTHAAEQALTDLRNLIVDHAAEQARLEKERGRRRVFWTWRQTLQALTQLERGREQPFDYLRFNRSQNLVEFVLATDPPEDVLGQVRLCELVDGGLLSGEVVRTTDDGIVLRVAQGDPRQLPARGRLKVDTRLGRAALRRQELALDMVQRRAGVRPDLEDLLLEPAKADEPTPAPEPEWAQVHLDEAKKVAVRAALNCENALLVEGPPGTGKTTFITELIFQELRRNPGARILLSSQTHAALDNVLERLTDLDSSIGLLRLGRAGDERVSAHVQDLLIGRQIETWRSEVIRQGRASLRNWARDRGLSERDVEIAVRLEELAAVEESLAGMRLRRTHLEERLEALRAERRRGTETANETIGSVQDLISEAELEQRDFETERDELIERLRELGAIGSPADVEGLRPDELRARAEGAVDRSHPAFTDCCNRLRLLADWHGRFGRGPEFEAAALVRAQVVAATCVGFGGTPGWDAIEFDLCIVDEASKATATELLVPMARARRWVLVGDHRQLPPYVDEALLDRGLLREFDLTEEEVRETLFERFRAELPTCCRFLLSVQHRMVPAIGDLISACFYDGELKSTPKERPGWLAMSLPQPVVWISTAHLGARREERSGTSHTNPLEARCVRNLLGSLNLLAGGAGAHLHVGVLTGYAEQRDELERRVSEKRSDWPHLDIECNTVDAFQGRQVDIAIYSVTRSNVQGRLGFLRERRRLNVALSRGQVGLVIVGDEQFAATADGDNPFASVIRHIHRDTRCCVDEARP